MINKNKIYKKKSKINALVFASIYDTYNDGYNIGQIAYMYSAYGYNSKDIKNILSMFYGNNFYKKTA